MFDLGGGEMLLIGIVALVVVGPKELPALFRTVGQFTGKARAMAREFTSAMNSAADQAGVSELNKTLKAAAKPMSYAADRLRETTGLATASLNGKPPVMKPGGATEKLAAEREAAKATLRETTAQKVEDRKAAAEAIKAEVAEAELQAPVVADTADHVAKPRKPRGKTKPTPGADHIA